MTPLSYWHGCRRVSETETGLRTGVGGEGTQNIKMRKRTCRQRGPCYLTDQNLHHALPIHEELQRLSPLVTTSPLQRHSLSLHSQKTGRSLGLKAQTDNHLRSTKSFSNQFLCLWWKKRNCSFAKCQKEQIISLQRCPTITNNTRRKLFASICEQKRTEDYVFRTGSKHSVQLKIIVNKFNCLPLVTV